MTVKNTSSGAMIFVYCSLFLDAMGHGLLAPIIPTLIGELAGVNVSEAAVYGGAIVALFATVQFFATPLLGNLSDAIGRRPVLVTSIFAFGINYMLMAISPSLAWLFVAQGFAGLFGATPAVAAAFIADRYEAGERAKRFGTLGAAYGLGFMFGPTLSGVLAEWGHRVPIWVAAGLILTNAVVGLFVFKESLPESARKPFRLAGASPWGVFKQVSVNKAVPKLLLVVLLLHIALNTVPVVWPYFTTWQFNWTAREIGLSMGFYGICSIIAQGILVGKLSARFGDKAVALIGMSGLVISSLAFAFITSQWFILIFIFPSAMGFMSNAGLMSQLSAMTDASSQGAAQGAFSATRSLGAIISPLAIPPLFHLFTTPDNTLPVFAGIPFLLAALLALLAIIVMKRTV